MAEGDEPRMPQVSCICIVYSEYPEYRGTKGTGSL